MTKKNNGKNAADGLLEDIAEGLDPVSKIMMLCPDRLSDELVRKLDAKYGATLFMMESCVRDVKARDGKDDPYAIGATRAMLRFLAKHIEVVLKETDAMVLAETEEGE